jgi:riboflavin-specific deaminase-like protein
MRALCDAIIVGAETVAADNPQLTTRLVPGKNPLRIVLDPRRRLTTQYKVFQDRQAPSMLVCGDDVQGPAPRRHGQAEVVGVPARDGRLDLAALLRTLGERGLDWVFVEGGGVTVSAFLGAGLLQRLQIAVAPVVIGNGRLGLQLPAPDTMGDCLRPHHRLFRMGNDILFDCEPARRPSDAGSSVVSTQLQRVR